MVHLITSLSFFSTLHFPSFDCKERTKKHCANGKALLRKGLFCCQGRNSWYGRVYRLDDRAGTGQGAVAGETDGKLPATGLLRIQISRKLCALYNSCIRKLSQISKSAEVEKLWKTPLTNGRRSAIICERWTRGDKNRLGAAPTDHKKVEKTFQKPLDKRKEMWYNSRAHLARIKDRFERTAKEFEKT